MKFTLEPVFALSEICTDRYKGVEQEVRVYFVWMGPSLEDIIGLAEKSFHKEEYSEPILLTMPRDEIFKRINEEGDNLRSEFRDYRDFHGESAILLYTTTKNIFE